MSKLKKSYNDYSSFLRRKFNMRVQKIAVDAGFTCPNRDGTKALNGCTYCNNDTFKPFYCTPKKTISNQLNEGIAFFSKKYKTQKYLAYFQAYSNTYADISQLKKIYSEALSVSGVIGLIIATRPDCIDNKKLDYLEQLAKKYFIVIEYGIESCNNKTLEKINRSHTFEDSVNALQLTAGRGIQIGVHIILGLPGESNKTMINHARILSNLHFDTLKLHQLQIIKHTEMAKQYAEHPEKFNLFSATEYIDFVVKFVEMLRPDIIIERFISEAPAELLIAPKWGRLKNFEIVAKIEKKFKTENTRQGKFYNFINIKKNQQS